MKRTLRQLRSDEGGAVALLALAGALITFMTALILFDAGFAVRHKFKAQISADAGAFSEAAVKARVMNNLAYTNIVKRTWTGIWGMYVGMMYQFWDEIRGSIACAVLVTGDDTFEALRDPTVGDATGKMEDQGMVRDAFVASRSAINDKCDDVADQYMVFFEEVDGDWWHLRVTDPTRDGYDAFVRESGQMQYKIFYNNLARMTFVQDRLIETAPQWSAVEGQARARASGADYANMTVTDLPTEKGNATQLCLRGYGHRDGSIATGPELRAEIRANRDIHARKSDPRSQFKDGALTANLERGLQHMGGVGCTALESNFGEVMEPMIPTAEEAQDYFNTGRETPLERMRNDHFLFLRSWEDFGHPEVPVYEGVSCGEIADLEPEYLGFRASWVPRIAPVTKCGQPIGRWK